MPTKTQLANALRFLSIDAVQRANSGHPGMPMGMADIAEVLWRDFLQHNPSDPHWLNRDRFVLSNGHGSMLLYALLHLSGYDVSRDDLKNFRQLHSKTAGHPELGITPGVETTTGPLGQGLANAVGMAMAEKHLAARFNQDNFPIVNHHTYAFVGDGCLMEGISHEVCSLAGTLKLGKLIVFWDDNGISIDGDVQGWFAEDTAKRFEAYGWHVVTDVDGHQAENIRAAIDKAHTVSDKPTLICCKTTIGFGSPNLAGTAKTHGSPLGDEEIQRVRDQLQWPHAAFDVPKDVCDAWDARSTGQEKQNTWQQLFTAYEEANPDLAKAFQAESTQHVPDDWATFAKDFVQQTQSTQTTTATRKSSQQCIATLAKQLPALFGGSADLTGSNGTLWSDAETYTAENPAGNYAYYGVREFGMSAMMNGLALHGGVIPFGGTFLVFSDYARNAIRMAALMQQRVIFVLTHDSIGLGEDGPTHQPVEHAASLRLIPGLNVWRPCDSAETAAAWCSAIESKGPTALLLSRQNLQAQTRDINTTQAMQQGAYVLQDCEGQPDAILIATGSEVDLAMQAAAKSQRAVRVVSMPCVELFLAQPQSVRDQVLPPTVTHRIAIEAGVTAAWHQFVGLEGHVVGLDRFGESAPAPEVYAACGITVEKISELIKEK
ncbi:MAG: transketolase [marine bacterium B5-7]|nr:MAG: transketolase [marine bacterium B5-7]